MALGSRISLSQISMAILFTLVGCGGDNNSSSESGSPCVEDIDCPVIAVWEATCTGEVLQTPTVDGDMGCVSGTCNPGFTVVETDCAANAMVCGPDPNTNEDACIASDDSASASECQQRGFAEGTSTQGLIFRGGWAFEAATPDETVFMSVQGLTTAEEPFASGTYTLTGENHKDCELCLLAGTGCNNGICEQYFYAHEGTVELTSVGTDAGEIIAGRLSNVVFEEVAIDRSRTSTKVPNGSRWCFNDYAFSAAMSGDPKSPQEIRPFEPAAQSCVGAGNGVGIGNNIRNLQLPNCNGDMVSLHGGCGVNKAVWFVHTAGWCVACSDWIDRVNQLDQQEAADDLEVYYVLGQTPSYEVPTSDYCRQYAQQAGVDPARVLIDNNAENIPWRTFEESISTYEMEGIPWNAILRGSNMEYIWADNANNGRITTLQDVLNDLLEKEVTNVPTW